MSSIKARLVAGALAVSLVSASGVALIKTHEGVRYTSYPDPGTGGAPWTICYGHTSGVRPGMTATQAQCDRWLADDIRIAEGSVRKLVRVSLSQTEYDAYTSFVFNAGEHNFSNSTMLRLLNAGQHAAACNQFPRWVYADKRKLKGLVTRRYEEQALCLKPSRIVYNGSPIN